MIVDPPAPFSFRVVRCPSCHHGIDPHGSDPGGHCGVGTWDESTGSNFLCPCLWSPNDIAAILLKKASNDERASLRIRVEEARTSALDMQKYTTGEKGLGTPRSEWHGGQADAFGLVLASLDDIPAG